MASDELLLDPGPSCELLAHRIFHHERRSVDGPRQEICTRWDELVDLQVNRDHDDCRGVIMVMREIM